VAALWQLIFRALRLFFERLAAPPPYVLFCLFLELFCYSEHPPQLFLSLGSLVACLISNASLDRRRDQVRFVPSAFHLTMRFFRHRHRVSMFLDNGSCFLLDLSLDR